MIADRVAYVQIIDLGDGEDVARDRHGDVAVLAALHEQQPRRPRRLAGARVDQRLIRLVAARQDANETQVADELVGDGLEDLTDKLSGRRRLQHHLVAPFLRLAPFALFR